MNGHDVAAQGSLVGLFAEMMEARAFNAREGHEKGDFVLLSLIRFLARDHPQRSIINRILTTWHDLPKWYS